MSPTQLMCASTYDTLRRVDVCKNPRIGSGLVLCSRFIELAIPGKRYKCVVHLEAEYLDRFPAAGL